MPSSTTAKRILFLNPEVVGAFAAWSPGITRIGANNPVGVPGAPGGIVSLRNDPIEALSKLVAGLACIVVCTRDGAPYDARDQLAGRGAVIPTHEDWRTDQREPNRSKAIEAWWRAHGQPPALIVDRAEVAVAGISRIVIAPTGHLSTAIVDDAIAQLAAAV